MKKEIRLILADDHPIYREGLAALLEHDENIRVVGQASNGGEVLELLETVEVDIVLLDLEMQPLDGLSTVRRIKADGLSVKTIVLTLHRDATLMRTLIEEGVHGYILKDARAQEVIDAVKLVYEGQGYVSATASGLLMEVVKDGEAGKIGEKLGELTPSEIRILRKIATDMTSKEIAAELGLSTRTVENHRARICKKMNLSGVHSLVKFAFDNRDRL
jgi:DNA-binding NarL/FixJ family response regulator